MVPRIHHGGRGMSGLVDYVTHDQTTPDKSHPTSATRVGWIENLNLPACQPEIAALIMSRTAADADQIKREAGTSTRGRKLKKPVAHLTLSWAPNERPDRAEMMSAVRGALKAIGYDKCQALVAEHHDRDQLHVHIAVCRIDPTTGKACGRANDARRLSAWAEQYERSRGPLLIPVREERNDCRQAFSAAVEHEMRGWTPTTPTAVKTKRDQTIQRTAARRQAIEHVRTTDRHHLPPTAAPAARGPGRPGPHSPEDRAAWSALHAEHAAANTTPRIQRTERVEVARILRDTRAVTVQADEIIHTMAGAAVRPAAPPAVPAVRVPAAPGREIPPLRRGSVPAPPAAPPVRVPAAPEREIPPLRRGSVPAPPAAPAVRVPAAPEREIPPLRRGSVPAAPAAPAVRVPAAPGREIPPLRRGSVPAPPAAPPVRVPAAPARPAARDRHTQTADETPVGKLRPDLEARARDQAVIDKARRDKARRDKARRDKAQREARVTAAAVRGQAGAAAAMAEMMNSELTTDAGAGIGAERPAPVVRSGSKTGPRRDR